METTNLNINPTSGEKSEKTEKVRKTAAKSAQFAGAAGLGVAGTMAANAMNTHEEDKTDEVSTEPPVTPGTTPSEEVTAEAVSDFNPNDIMIEVEEAEVVNEDKPEAAETSVGPHDGDVALVEPQPITGEDFVTVQPEEVLIAQVDPTDEPYNNVEPDMYGGPGDWEDFDQDDIVDDLLADGGDVDEDIDIADDILA